MSEEPVRSNKEAGTKVRRSRTKRKSTATKPTIFESAKLLARAAGKINSSMNRLTRVLGKMSVDDMDKLSKLLEDHSSPAKKTRKRRK